MSRTNFHCSDRCFTARYTLQISAAAAEEEEVEEEEDIVALTLKEEEEVAEEEETSAAGRPSPSQTIAANANRGKLAAIYLTI